MKTTLPIILALILSEDVDLRCAELKKQCKFNGNVQPCIKVKQTEVQALKDELYFCRNCND